MTHEYYYYYYYYHYHYCVRTEIIILKAGLSIIIIIVIIIFMNSKLEIFLAVIFYIYNGSPSHRVTNHIYFQCIFSLFLMITLICFNGIIIIIIIEMI
jgi:hypothetical protein